MSERLSDERLQWWINGLRRSGGPDEIVMRPALLSVLEELQASRKRIAELECPHCGGAGVVDSGGQNPDGSWIDVSCICAEFPKKEERIADLERAEKGLYAGQSMRPTDQIDDPTWEDIHDRDKRIAELEAKVKTAVGGSALFETIRAGASFYRRIVELEAAAKAREAQLAEMRKRLWELGYRGAVLVILDQAGVPTKEKNDEP